MAMSGHRPQILDLVSSGQEDAVKEFIEKGGDINEQDEMGHCAVFAAIARNDLNILTILINAGARVDIRDAFGREPLSYAQGLATVGYSKKIVDLIEETLTTYRHPTP